jgi:glycosyltransferase involved in cell wall biosynthesis
VRVLFISPFSELASGSEESLLDTAEPLIEKGVEAHLVLPKPGPQVPRYESLGMKVHYLPMSRITRRLRPVDLLGFGARLTRGAVTIARLLRRESIDLVHSNMEVVLDGAAAARALRIPHVFHYRGNSNDDPKLVFDALTATWTLAADHIYCISHATAEIFHRRGRGRKVEVLYDPVKVQLFTSAPRLPSIREELGARDEEILVGNVGRIHPRKDLETFLRACAQLSRQFSGLKFTIVGRAEGTAESEYKKKLEGLAEELGIRHLLTFPGNRSDTPLIFKALDVFVISSRNEGFGRVVVEAMAAGRPVVLTREGAFPELVREGVEGFFAPPGDYGAFSARIAELIQNRELCKRLGEAGILASSRFGQEEVASRVYETYQQLIARRQ